MNLHFMIFYHPAHDGPSRSIGREMDVNAATIATNLALVRLSELGRDVEVKIVRCGSARR